MKLKICNIGKIGNACFELNGITLLVGDNNTGKTTVGKCLYTFFASLYQIDTEVIRYRKNRIISLIMNFFDNFRHSVSKSYVSLKLLVSNFLDNEDENAGIQGLRTFLIEKLANQVTKTEIDDFCKQILDVKHVPDSTIRKYIIQQWFKSIFAEQYLRIDDGVSLGRISTEISGHEVSVEINSKNVNYKSDININQKVYFIKDSSLLEELAQNRASIFAYSKFSFNSTLQLEILKSFSNNVNNEDSVVDIIFEAIDNDEVYQKIYDLIKLIIHGDFQFSKDEGLKFNEEGQLQPLEVQNVSEGLKQFGIIGLLIQRKVLCRGDILILDEPEVHLHPVWQMKYAEILVVMQKLLKLHIVISTHSPDFAQAVRLYAMKYKISDFLNAYITKPKSTNEVEYEQVSVDNWDYVFDGFVKCFDSLSVLREEVGE